MSTEFAPASPSKAPGTNGFQVAQVIQVSGTGLTSVGVNLGTQDGGESLNSSFGAVGQGIGTNQVAAGGDSKPGAQYACTLSLSGATVNGKAYPTTISLIATVVDVLNDTVPSMEYYNNEFNWVALGSVPKSAGTYFNRTNNFVSTNAAPASGSPAYPAGAIVTLGTPSGTYDADIVLTAAAVGQCVVKVQAPWANNDLGESQDDGYDAPPGFNTPLMGIETEIVVTVIK